MRPDLVVIAGITLQNLTQLDLAKGDDVIEALVPDRYDQPFSETIIRYVSGGASDVLLILVDWRMVRPSGTWGTGST
jgi:hypothetical protein